MRNGGWTTVDEMNEPERARIELIPSAKLWCITVCSDGPEAVWGAASPRGPARSEPIDVDAPSPAGRPLSRAREGPVEDGHRLDRPTSAAIDIDTPYL